jgi:hypothetical protein
MKMIGLAPIEVKILLWRGSPQKIVTNSGISSLKKHLITILLCFFQSKKQPWENCPSHSVNPPCSTIYNRRTFVMSKDNN